MKKLLALVLVLSLAASAQAGFMLSVNGDQAPDEITLEPSDTIWLDILVDPGTVFNAGDWQIRVNGPGSLDTANVAFAAPTRRVYTSLFGGAWYLEDDAAWQGTVLAKAEAQDVIISAADLSFNMTNNLEVDDFGGVGALSFPVLMDGLQFHCEGEGDVIVELITFGRVTSLVETANGYDPEAPTVTVVEAGTVLDSILIHQIPEPMTLSLLAMGGLALLRRRR